MNNFLCKKANTFKVLLVAAMLGASFAASGHWEVSTIDVDASDLAKFKYPSGIAFDSKGNLFVADTEKHSVRKIDVSSGFLTTIAGNGIGLGFEVEGKEGAKFNRPSGIASDSQGNLFVADNWHAIRKIDISSGLVEKIAGADKQDGNGSGENFNSPLGVACDSQGNIFVADTRNNAIKKIDISSGLVEKIAGSDNSEISGETDGPGESATFSNPSGIAFDSQGNIFVVDTGNNAIRMLTLDRGGWKVSTIAGGDEKFKYLSGIACDSQGNIFVTDKEKHSILQLTPDKDGSWKVSTIAGGSEGFQDGKGTEAKFNFPEGIACDKEDNLFVTDIDNDAKHDSRNGRIRKLIFISAPPVAEKGTAEGYEGADITGKLVARDDDKDELIYSVVKDIDNKTMITEKGGKVSINSDGSYEYTNRFRYFVGEDSFDYQVDDGHGGTSKAQITVTVKELLLLEAIKKIYTDPKWVVGYFARKIANFFA